MWLCVAGHKSSGWVRCGFAVGKVGRSRCTELYMLAYALRHRLSLFSLEARSERQLTTHLWTGGRDNAQMEAGGARESVSLGHGASARRRNLRCDHHVSGSQLLLPGCPDAAEWHRSTTSAPGGCLAAMHGVEACMSGGSLAQAIFLPWTEDACLCSWKVRGLEAWSLLSPGREGEVRAGRSSFAGPRAVARSGEAARRCVK